MDEKGSQSFQNKAGYHQKAFFQCQVNAQSYRVVFLPNSRKQMKKYWTISFDSKVPSIKWGISKDYPKSNWSLLNKIPIRSFFSALFLIIISSSHFDFYEYKEMVGFKCSLWVYMTHVCHFPHERPCHTTPELFGLLIYLLVLCPFPCHSFTCFEFMKQHHTRSVR